MKEITEAGTFEVITSGGSEHRIPRPPRIEWEAAEIVVPRGHVMIRGRIRDFDGEDRLDSYPGAVMEVPGYPIVASPIEEGIISAGVWIDRPGTYYVRIYGAAAHCDPVRVVVT